jgi:superfamily II DNA or RNA helicase
LIKAPTGFGKTHIMYKIISQLKPNSILILTPRILLNKQIVENKYICNYINGYKIYHNSDAKFIFTGDKNIIVTACYQSYDNFINTQFDLVIYDEAHTISDKEIFIESKYKLFLTATPTEDMTTKENIFGKIIEKVKVYELINMNILCDFKTICKKLEVKKDKSVRLDVLEKMLTHFVKEDEFEKCTVIKELYDYIDRNVSQE